MLSEIYKTKIEELLQEEASRRGITLNKFDIEDFIENLSKNITIGFPITRINTQTDRAVFDSKSYSSFVKGAEFDLNTLLTAVKKARLDIRGSSTYADITVKQQLEQIALLEAGINSMLSISAPKPEMGVFSKNIEIDLSGSNKIYNEVDDLSFLTDFNTLTLPLQGSASDIMDMSFLSESTAVLTPQIANSKIIDASMQAPISNLGTIAMDKMVYRLAVKDKLDTIDINMVVTLPTTTRLNAVQLTSGSGQNLTVQCKVAEVGDNFIDLGVKEKVIDTCGFLFPVRNVSKVLLTFTVPVAEITNDLSVFVLVLSKLTFSRYSFNETGSIVITDIDPQLRDASIISAKLSTTETTPADTEITYAISNDAALAYNPSTVISGKADNIGVSFNIAESVEDTHKVVSLGSFYIARRNNIEFENVYEWTNSLASSKIYEIEKATTVWLKQGVLKENRSVDSEKVKITDAFSDLVIDPSGRALQCPIYATITMSGYPLLFDSTSGVWYIELPSDLHSSNSISVTLKSSINDTSTSLPINITTIRRINLGSSIPSIDNFSYLHIVYLGKLEGYADITRGSISMKTNLGPLSPSNIAINPDTARIVVDYENNTLYSTISTGRVYLDCYALTNLSKLFIYEGYFYNPNYQDEITFVSPITADVNLGEYAVIKHIESGVVTKLSNVASIRGLRKGWYLVSLLSKPFNGDKSNPARGDGIPGGVVKTFLSTRENSFGLPFIFALNPTTLSTGEVVPSANYFTYFGAYKEQATYKPSGILLNASTFKSENTFTVAKEFESAVLKYKIISPKTSDNYIGQELINVTRRYYKDYDPENQRLLYLKIDMTSRNNEVTPSLDKVKLSIEYV